MSDEAKIEAIKSLRGLLRNVDQAWRAVSVVGPNQELSASLDQTGKLLQNYLRAHDDQPEARALRERPQQAPSGARSK